MESIVARARKINASLFTGFFVPSRMEQETALQSLVDEMLKASEQEVRAALAGYRSGQAESIVVHMYKTQRKAQS